MENMDSKNIFLRAVTLADDSVTQIKATQLTNKTPRPEWDLRELVNHMVYELSWIPDILAGKKASEVKDAYSGDLLGDNWQTAWTQVTDQARRAVELTSEDTTVHLTDGKRSVADYLVEMGLEILAHGWDVSRSMYCSLVFDPAITQALYDTALPRKETFITSGTLREPLEVPSDSPLQVKLLGLMGRSPEVEDKA